MLKLTYKVSIWKDLIFSEGTKIEDIVQEIQKGSVYNAYDMDSFISEEVLDETEEEMFPNENFGCSTIEIWSGDVLVWSNGLPLIETII